MLSVPCFTSQPVVSERKQRSLCCTCDSILTIIAATRQTTRRKRPTMQVTPEQPSSSASRALQTQTV